MPPPKKSKKPATTKPASKKPASRATPGSATQLFTLSVAITQGPITEAFAKANPECVRWIQIRGDQTLEALHQAIFEAFDRDDAHLYEFQFGKGPMDPSNTRYVAIADEFSFSHVKKPAGLASETTLGSLELKAGQHFGYWFDFGDDCFHQIDVEWIDDAFVKASYPQVIRKIGESPPQYT